jgi:hypothetical protein
MKPSEKITKVKGDLREQHAVFHLVLVEGGGCGCDFSGNNDSFLLGHYPIYNRVGHCYGGCDFAGNSALCIRHDQIVI